MTHGRGAWNNSGAGGTKKYKDETKPGPYYYLGSGDEPTTNQDAFAVHGAVKAYQRALNRRLGDKYAIKVDGHFGPSTVAAVTRFQQLNTDKGLTVWGGIGPDTSMVLLLPDVEKVVNAKRQSLE